MSQHTENLKTQEQEEALSSISPFKVLLAVAIGLAVVIYMFTKDFNFAEFQKIEFNNDVFFWVGMAALFMCSRHFFYMLRLRIITNGFFSWRKCFELVVMWEFSSAVTPTTAGGAAVAVFAIAQEKLSGGKTAMIVLYAVVTDTFCFLSALLIFFLLFGPIMVQPGATDLNTLIYHTEWGAFFVLAYVVMMIYGSIFFYGVMINAKKIENVLLWFCKIPFLKRYKDNIVRITNDMDMASEELKSKSWTFHLSTYLATMSAWGSKFMILNCLIVAFVASSTNPEVQAHYNNFLEGEMHFSTFWQQIFIYARQQAMYVITAVVPSPGGSGVAEYAFQKFHYDYIPTKETGIASAATIMVIMATVWRLLTYHVYLFGGAIVVPNWLNNIIRRNKEEARLKAEEENMVNADAE